MSHKKNNKKHPVKGLGDVTINDFANSAVAKSRIRKSSSNVNMVLKQEVEKSWDEKTEEDFEGEFVAEESEDGIVSYIIQRVEPRTTKKISFIAENYLKDDFGKVYPLDIWFLISEYICPKDVGVFAAICKSSFQVVCSAKFWFSLYRRYYKSVPNLPEQLQPECLVRKYGLRASVIRALYYMYNPFIHKLKNLCASNIFDDLSILEKYQCDLIWYHWKIKSSWIYYIKMRKKSNFLVHARSTSSRPDLLQVLDDIFANPEENCKILRITCSYFVQMPEVVGLTLRSTSMNLSRNMRQYRLQLVFGSSITSSFKSVDDASSTVMVFEPIIDVRVLDWWHPLYPFSHSIQSLLDREICNSDESFLENSIKVASF